MLGYKHRVSLHRGLFAVIWNEFRRNSFFYKVAGMRADCVQAFLFDIEFVFIFEFEFASEI